MSMLPPPLAERPGANLVWKDFRAGLENLDLVCVNDRDPGFSSWIDDRDFGDLHVRRVGSSGAALRGERSPSRIETHREDVIWVCMVLSGLFSLEQRGERAELRQGDLTMVDALQPYRLETLSNADTLWIGSPRTLISRYIWDVDEMLGVRIEGNRGAGMMASRVLQATFGSDEGAPEAEANRIARGVLDVLGAATDSCRLNRSQSNYRNGIARRIKNYIEQHLDDDTLTVARIARDQSVSPRYLAKIFEMENETVSAWIWRRRLERCHAALLSTSSATTVSEIAFAHGFKNLSHFSKAFRERFGECPRAVLRRVDARH